MHNDEVVGIFNIESEQVGAFDEDDRQIAEIFGRYVALAMNILNLLVVERCTTSNRVMEALIGELEEPLRVTREDVATLHELQQTAGEAVREPLARVAEHLETMIDAVARAKSGPTGVTGAKDLAPGQDPLMVGKRILIADDDPSIRKTLASVFAEKGAVVEACQDGYEACGALDKASFDMVISDIRMPYRNGYEIYAAAQRCRAGMPVVLMTGFGYDPSHSIVRAGQEGLTSVLFKPFSVDVLLEEVCKALGKK
jgi:CheY-like chemotaxis protein